MNNQLPDYFWADRLTPLNYYGHGSSPINEVCEIQANSNFDREKYKEEIIRFHDLKRKCMGMEVQIRKSVWERDIWDDMITIECQVEDGTKIYVGFHGCTFSIGKDLNPGRREPQSYRTVGVIS